MKIFYKQLQELSEWLEYDLPENLLGKVLEGKYRGQKQKWFIMKFVGKDNEINVKTKNPEFLDWKWIGISKLPSIAVSFKIDLYKKLKEELNFLNFNYIKFMVENVTIMIFNIFFSKFVFSVLIEII